MIPSESARRHVPGLDGLRGIALLAVLGFHMQDRSSGAFLRGGSLGVDLFFVLSGFLITSILAREWDGTGAIRLGRFYYRRALRLLPSLVALLVGMAFVFPYSHGRYYKYTIGRAAPIILLYATNWVRAFSPTDGALVLGPLNHLWSLAVEEQFYFVWPLVLLACLRARVSRRWLLLLTAGLTVASAVWCAHVYLERTSVWMPGHRAYNGTDTRAQGFLVGCLAALLVRADLVPRDGNSVVLGRWAGGIALGAMGYMMWTTGGATAPPLYVGGFLLFALLSAVIVVVVVTWPDDQWGRWLGTRPLAAVGVLSYSLYLWHHPLLALSGRYLHASAPALIPYCGVAASFAVAVPCYFLVERPFLRLKARIGNS